MPKKSQINKYSDCGVFRFLKELLESDKIMVLPLQIEGIPW